MDNSLEPSTIKEVIKGTEELIETLKEDEEMTLTASARESIRSYRKNLERELVNIAIRHKVMI